MENIIQQHIKNDEQIINDFKHAIKYLHDNYPKVYQDAVRLFLDVNQVEEDVLQMPMHKILWYSRHTIDRKTTLSLELALGRMKEICGVVKFLKAERGRKQ